MVHVIYHSVISISTLLFPRKKDNNNSSYGKEIKKLLSFHEFVVTKFTFFTLCYVAFVLPSGGGGLAFLALLKFLVSRISFTVSLANT